jgi:hypothetical protein
MSTMHTHERSNAERAQSVMDAVEVMDNLGDGSWTERDALSLVEPVDLVAGLREYANYLEALLVIRGMGVGDVRRAARQSAERLRARP